MKTEDHFIPLLTGTLISHGFTLSGKAFVFYRNSQGKLKFHCV